MSALGGWRAALRIARRDALRAKGRSALVVAMIALPVLGVTAADVTYRSAEPTAAERLTAELGSADAKFSDAGMGATPVEQLPDVSAVGTPGGKAPAREPEGDVDVEAAIPAGARHITRQSVPATVSTAHGVAGTEITELSTGDPMARGMIDLVEGEFPDAPGELAATGAFLESAGLKVGSKTEVRGLDRTFTITASVELPDALAKRALYAEPGAVIAPWQQASTRDKNVLPPSADKREWLVKAAGNTGVTWADVLAANKTGVVVESRSVVLAPPPDSEVPLAARIGGGFGDDSTELGIAAVTIVAMAVLEVVLLAGPAFAVGARRSRRQLGLLGTCGGDRRHIRSVVLAGGLVLGTIGAVTGAVLGIGLTALLRPIIEGWTGKRFGTLETPPLEIAAIAAIGLVTGVLAALVPAVVAARQSVLEALTGRKGVRHASRTLPTLGAAALALGVTIALFGGTTGAGTLVAGGSIIAELGLLCCIPVIVGFLGRLGRRLPLVPRLALRDAARNRGRTAPAVAAVMAAVAGSVAIATYTVSERTQMAYDVQQSLTPGTVALVADTLESRTDTRQALALARPSAERSLPLAPGGRADFGRVWAGSDCNRYRTHDAEGNETGCGSLEFVKPAGSQCPLRGKGAAALAARLSAGEHKKLKESPACADENVAMDVFGTGLNNIVTGDEQLLRTYVGLEDPAALKALAAGTPVLLNSAFAKDGKVTLKAVHTYGPKDGAGRKAHPGKARTVVSKVPVYIAPDTYVTTPGIRMIMPPGSAEKLGLHTEPVGSVYRVRHQPTDAERQKVDDALLQAGNTVFLHTPMKISGADDPMLLILALFAGVVTLGAAAITTGLAKADAEADLTTLSAVGAPPRVRRSLSGFQCAVVAVTGVLLGTAAGLVPAVALRLVDLRQATAAMRANPMDSAYTPIVLPWTTIGILTVAVPVLAGLLAAGLTRSRLALARRAG
ncbi:FtsX-like permease family protein [Streptomyces sp. NPDC050504]|uniref:FtsX-like permease family protein n=1 Tax=Streptomyces sp. NPDC050504 TaxID=3365618 RepID=UPI00378F09E1